MRRYLLILIFLASSSATAQISDPIEEIQAGRISLETIKLLVDLDRNELKIGYGICMAENRGGCASDGTLGYGLCMAANRGGCAPNGSLGYGICMVANRGGCDPTGSLGYGICMAANRGGCSPN